MSFRSRSRLRALVVVLVSIAFAGLGDASLAQETTAPSSEVTLAGVEIGPCGALQEGTDTAETLTGTADGDRIKGAGGADMLVGLDKADCLRGGDQRDVLEGGDGSDRLIGSQAGDRMLARDGARDVVRCGRGHDVAVLDRRDRFKGCEEVSRRPPESDPDDGGGEPPPGEDPPPDGPPPDDPPPDDGAFTVPASVPSGCSSDATRQILSWIASVPDGSTVRFDADACYRIEGTLELRNRNLTIDGNGSTFRSLNAPDDQRALWRAWDSSISFRDMTIDGSYADGGVHDVDLQHAHAIDLRGTDGVVENVSMSDLAGDCVYFGLGADRSSGAVRDSSCRRVGRNAVSVTAGDDIRVERMTTDRIGFIAFDVEPNSGPGWGSSRVTFDSNTIGSYYLYAWAVIGGAPISDQSFTNNRVTGRGLRIAALYPDHRPQRLTVTGNTSDTKQSPAAMDFYGVDGLTVKNNTVPMTSGTMAGVETSCRVDVSGNAYPGGSREVSISHPAC